MSNAEILRVVGALDVTGARAILGRQPELARVVDDRGWTLLHVACAANARELGVSPGRSLAMVKLLLAHGLDPDAELVADGDRLNPVWFAVARGRNRAVVELLARLGARPTGLFAAAWCEDLAMIALLLRHGAELDEYVDDETPFLHAWKNRRFRAAAALLRAGADIDVQDGHKLTALHYALEHDYEPARVRWLIRQGASAELVDANGVSARVKAGRKHDGAYLAAVAPVRRSAGRKAGTASWR